MSSEQLTEKALKAQGVNDALEVIQIICQEVERKGKSE